MSDINEKLKKVLAKSKKYNIEDKLAIIAAIAKKSENTQIHDAINDLGDDSPTSYIETVLSIIHQVVKEKENKAASASARKSAKSSPSKSPKRAVQQEERYDDDRPSKASPSKKSKKSPMPDSKTRRSSTPSPRKPKPNPASLSAAASPRTPVQFKLLPEPGRTWYVMLTENANDADDDVHGSRRSRRLKGQVKMDLRHVKGFKPDFDKTTMNMIKEFAVDYFDALCNGIELNDKPRVEYEEILTAGIKDAEDLQDLLLSLDLAIPSEYVNAEYDRNIYECFLNTYQFSEALKYLVEATLAEYLEPEFNRGLKKYLKDLATYDFTC
ncbi:hypothetical protein MP638_000193 [Amoeboaphelidium occidentale]|nr:hypothetical protein MP638_000193 [Amoeboaphelidium occidentale]